MSGMRKAHTPTMEQTLRCGWSAHALGTATTMTMAIRPAMMQVMALSVNACNGARNGNRDDKCNDSDDAMCNGIGNDNGKGAVNGTCNETCGRWR